MQKPFDIDDHSKLKIRYVPNRGDDDPIWQHVMNVLTGGQNAWAWDDWNELVKTVTDSDLTVGEWLKEKQANGNS